VVSGAPCRTLCLATAMIQPKRIVLVLVPAGGIAQDVFADRFQFVLVSDLPREIVLDSILYVMYLFPQAVFRYFSRSSASF
jgi:hypothetical protein